MKVLGYSITDGMIADSDGEICSSGSSYLEFLLQPKSDTMRILYHLDYNVQSLLVSLNLDKEEVGLLSSSTKLKVDSYHLRYVVGKLFSVKRLRAFSYFADAHHYVNFPDQDLQLDPVTLASRAKEVGDQVYGVLAELKISASSLINPIRAYEKSLVEQLHRMRVAASGDLAKSRLIDEIGSELYGEAWKAHARVN